MSFFQTQSLNSSHIMKHTLTALITSLFDKAIIFSVDGGGTKEWCKDNPNFEW